MDSITHIALGAVTGEALAGKSLGKRAMILGAVAQSLPDIDIIASFWLPPANNLLAHRGFTHSFLFGILATIICALIAERSHRSHNLSRWQWLLFFGSGIFIHILLDAFNSYGVGWFEPFSHQRVSFNILFVADPFYSLWPGIAFLALLLLGKNDHRRKKWVLLGLALSSLYLVYACINKINIDRQARKSFVHNHIAYKRYFTTPTPLNNWLWYIVAEDDSGYHIGYRSVFDRKRSIDFSYFHRQSSLLDPVRNDEDTRQLIQFSQGYYTVEQWHDTLVFNDLRFGQIIGWHDPREKFVFHYFLKHPDYNTLVVQRGRFAKWDRNNVKSLLKRIKGI